MVQISKFKKHLGEIPSMQTYAGKSVSQSCYPPFLSYPCHLLHFAELLLSYNVELGDALLHAINEENVEAVELLLQHQQQNKKDLSVSNKGNYRGENVAFWFRSGPMIKT